MKTVEEEDSHTVEVDDGLSHVCHVLKELVGPWTNTSRILYGDSYFASVSTCHEMDRIGFRFLGVVKAAHKYFPIFHLQRIELI